MNQQITVYHYNEQLTRIIDAHGTAQLTYRFDHDPPSLTVVCHQCGWDWCRMIPLFDDKHVESFLTVHHLCAACGNGTLLNLDLEYRDFEIPDELLARELELWHARWYPEYRSHCYV